LQLVTAKFERSEPDVGDRPKGSRVLIGSRKWPDRPTPCRLRFAAVRAEFELTGVHRTNLENFIRKIAGFPKDC
jgi:hypothetical protein